MAIQLNLNTERQGKNLPTYDDDSEHTRLNTPIPDTLLHLEHRNKHLVRVEFVRKSTLDQIDNKIAPKLIALQFTHFFNGKNDSIKIPFCLIGTPFQKKVWQALKNIPAGTQQTYGSLAKQLNTSPRAVGNACRRNPLPLLFPCHRIVGQHSAGGFMGHTKGHALSIKQWLLQHEAKNFR